jgi:hypothetical protein
LAARLAVLGLDHPLDPGSAAQAEAPRILDTHDSAALRSGRAENRGRRERGRAPGRLFRLG